MTERTIIEPEWLSESATIVAPNLIGCVVARKFPDGDVIRGMIVETEAYMAGDPACHAYQKKTHRNAPMFEAAGYAYVYLIYGIHHCFNIVTDRKDMASAVLVRALSLLNLPQATQLKLSEKKIARLAAGPGKLCRILGIDRSCSGHLLAVEHDLWLEHRPGSLSQHLQQGKRPIVQTTRIGISQGQELPWRWYLKDSPSVSVR